MSLGPLLFPIGTEITSTSVFDSTILNGIMYDREHIAIMLSSDGSRRLLDLRAGITGPILDPDDATVIRRPATTVASVISQRDHERESAGDPDAKLFYWGPLAGVRAASHEYLPYLDPDTTLADRRRPSQTDPVNQIPYLQRWRRELAIFAHWLDIFHGTRSATASSAIDREFVYSWCASIVGRGWEELEGWARIDPESRVPDTTDEDDDGLPDNLGATVIEWLTFLPAVQRLMDRICVECDIETYPRRFLRRADLPEFRSQYYHGQLRAAIHSTGWWAPGAILAQVPNLPRLSEEEGRAAIDRFYNGLFEHYDSAVAHYDEVVAGTLDHSHD